MFFGFARDSLSGVQKTSVVILTLIDIPNCFSYNPSEVMDIINKITINYPCTYFCNKLYYFWKNFEGLFLRI